MDNKTKFKLSRYKEIRALNSKNTTYLVYDIQNDKACVKKLINNSLKEIYVRLSKIKNPLLPKIYEIIDTEYDFIIIEEYIIGNNVDYIIKNNGIINMENACQYVIDIADTLSDIHNLGIVHRDITPNNIIIDNNNRARLLDFDIARTTGHNKSTDTTILGTAGFASPEQFGFAQTDARSDIYSLGVLLNYMVTGHIIQDKITDDMALREIIYKATKINPDDRYKNISEFIADVKFYYSKINISKDSYSKKEEKSVSNSNDLSLTAMFRSIPGFRTKNPLRMTTAILLYTSYIYYIFECIGNKTDYREFMYYSIGYLAIVFIPMWWFGNNGRQWDIIPILKKQNYKDKKNIALVIYFVVLIILVMLASKIKLTA